MQFAEIFAERGGFDLVLGNPPWIKIEWNESGVMGEAEPLYVLRDYSASRMAILREEVMERFNLRDTYLETSSMQKPPMKQATLISLWSLSCP